MFNSLRSSSPRCADMPVRYSTGLDNMFGTVLIFFYKYISATGNSMIIYACCYPCYKNFFYQGL